MDQRNYCQCGSRTWAWNLSCPAALLHMTHATPVAKAATPKYVTTANVHLRKGPGTKYSVILTIPKGKRIPYLEKNGSWIQTKYKGKTGYVSSQYIKKAGKSSPASYAAPSTKTPGTYVKGILVVNKKHRLPSSYNPGENKQARKAVNAMTAKAKKQTSDSPLLAPSVHTTVSVSCTTITSPLMAKNKQIDLAQDQAIPNIKPALLLISAVPIQNIGLKILLPIRKKRNGWVNTPMNLALSSAIRKVKKK